jgi:RHS repeat-associated protein
VLSWVDPSGVRTTANYDAMNQVTSTVDPAGGTTGFSYDPNGNLLSVTDAANNQTSFTYDTMDRPRTQKDALQRVTLYGYDAGGNLASLVDPRGQTTAVSYDGLGRRTFVGYNAVQGSGGTTYDSTIGYTYDGAGRLTKVADSASGNLTFGYDDFDNLTRATSPQGQVGYGYDAGGRLTSETIGQSSVGYQYDAADRLVAITEGGNVMVSKAYDAASRLTSLILPDGVKETPSYDAASQLTGISYSLGASTLGNLAYGYDANGRVSSVGGSWARTGLPQPVSSATYDAGNQLTSWNGTPISYDADGNLTSDGTSTYTWDARGQLSTVANSSLTASYGYDGLGRRVQSTVKGSSTQYLYDGANVVQELSGGAASASILSGGTDEYFSRNDSGGTRSFLTDRLGSTVAMADASGAVQTSYTYEPFGRASSSGASDPNPQQFTGRESDPTGLQYNRARYYSPTLQRFISQDPLGLGGGDVNTSAYVGDDPTNLTDPSGEFLFLIPMAVGCVTGAAFSLGWDLIGAKLTGRKLDVGGMLRDAGAACVAGALGGVFGKLAGVLLGRIIGETAAEGLPKLSGSIADSFEGGNYSEVAFKAGTKFFRSEGWADSGPGSFLGLGGC